jgi:predicted dehydrogenase
VNPVRWGILSTARIGTLKVIPGMRKSTAIELTAVASRSLASAREAAEQLGIGRAYGSYDELLADPAIEAVYIPLPNHLHVPMTLAAAQAGKHVLCEKPMSLTAADLEVLRPYTGRVHIREAFMVRFHPQWIQTRELVRGGAIGELRFGHVAFAYFNADPTNIRNLVAMGGGALYDIGCYAIAAGRWFFEDNPERVLATMDRDPVFKTDRSTCGLLQFSGGRQLTFAVSTQAAAHQRIELVGTKGRIEIHIPFNAPQDAPCSYAVYETGAAIASPPRTVMLPVADQYQLQAEAFSHAVRSGRPGPSGLDDASWNMRVIDALFASEKSARLEQP